MKAICLIMFCLLLTACGTSTEQFTPTAEPTKTPIYTPTPSLTASFTPSVSPSNTPVPKTTATPTPTHIPSLTATPLSTSTSTLGPPITRTPAPAAQCPKPGGELPPILTEYGIDEETGSQIVAYLNAGGSGADLQATLNGRMVMVGIFGELEPLQARVFSRDVTGDTTPEVVIDLTSANDGTEIYVFVCRGGKYELTYQSSADPIKAIEDLNMDGVADILMVGDLPYSLLQIVEWDGSMFVNLPFAASDPRTGEITETSLLEWLKIRGESIVADTDSDGSVELVLKRVVEWSYSAFGGAERERTETWAWNGYHFALARTEYASPSYRIHAIHDGDDASRLGDYARARGVYLQAITDPTLKDWSQAQLFDMVKVTPNPDLEERVRLDAYARYRVLLLDAIQNDAAAAQLTLDTLQSQHMAGPGQPYAELAGVFWNEYLRTQSLSSACYQAEDFGLLHATEVLIPLGSSTYGWRNRNYAAQDICPFGQPVLLATQIVPTLEPSPTPKYTPTSLPDGPMFSTPTPGPFPTLAPAVTRTPAPAQACPSPGRRQPVIRVDRIELLDTQILGYLNLRGSALGLYEALNQVTIPDPDFGPARLKAQVFVQDVTGDAVPDVVVDLSDSNRGDLLIYSCNAGKYKLLVDPSWGVYYGGLFAIVDMNQDGVPEVAYWTQDCGAGCLYGFNFLEWNGKNYVELSEPGGSYYSPAIWGGFGKIIDTDGNGTLELVLSGDWSPRYGPGRARHEVWMWNGRALAFFRSYYDPPVFRLQALFDGDDAFESEDYASALAAYQRAVFDESLFAWGPDQNPVKPRPEFGDPNERLELSAYARYRIMLVHVIQGHLPDAQTVFDALQSKFPAGTVGSQYAQMAAAFWSAYQANQSLSDACGKAVEFAAMHQEEIFGPLNWSSGNEQTRIQSPEDTCSMRDE